MTLRTTARSARDGTMALAHTGALRAAAVLNYHLLVLSPPALTLAELSTFVLTTDICHCPSSAPYTRADLL
jgi:hypothetical protein